MSNSTKSVRPERRREAPKSKGPGAPAFRLRLRRKLRSTRTDVGNSRLNHTKREKLQAPRRSLDPDLFLRRKKRPAASAADSIAADEFRSFAGGLFIDAVAGAAVLGETIFRHVAFLQHMGSAHRHCRCADYAVYRRGAARTVGQRGVAEFLQQVEMGFSIGASRCRRGVFVDRHD